MMTAQGTPTPTPIARAWSDGAAVDNVAGDDDVVGEGPPVLVGAEEALVPVALVIDEVVLKVVDEVVVLDGTDTTGRISIVVKATPETVLEISRRQGCKAGKSD